MMQTCQYCRRPFDDEWVVYCPVSRELAEQLQGDGLTTKTPVNMKLLGDGTIVITELRTGGVIPRDVAEEIGRTIGQHGCVIEPPAQRDGIDGISKSILTDGPDHG